jgi:hypothetical protein
VTEPLPTDVAPARRRPRWLVLAVIASVVALLVAGGAIYLMTRPVEPGFDSPEAIAALLAERGAPCADFDDDGGGRADKRGACYVDDEKIMIATFDSRAQVDEHWERQLGLAGENQTIAMVIGDTWTISGNARAYLRHAAEILQAEYRTN